MWSHMTVGVLRFGFGSVVLTTTDIESMSDMGHDTSEEKFREMFTGTLA